MPPPPRVARRGARPPARRPRSSRALCGARLGRTVSIVAVLAHLVPVFVVRVVDGEAAGGELLVPLGHLVVLGVALLGQLLLLRRGIGRKLALPLAWLVALQT